MQRFVSSLICTRIALSGDLARVLAFYLETGYTQQIDPADTLLIAEWDGEICAALRLCAENNTLVLRGMRVRPELRRQGVGSHLLRLVAEVLGEQECYCIPHAYLKSFYGQIDFQEVDPVFAPGFLRERLVKYRQVLGLQVILVRRAGAFLPATS